MEEVSQRLLEPTKASNSSRHHTVKVKEQEAKLKGTTNNAILKKQPHDGSARRRRHRPSFQGLAVIEESNKRQSQLGNVTPMASIASVKVAAMKTAKANRRRKSLDVLKMTCSNEAMRNMIDDTMGSVLKGLLVEGTPEERLQAVLTKAKEKGLGAERIFAYFNSGDPHVLEISKEQFLESIERLGNTILVSSQQELSDLVSKFDTDGDGFISIAEFKSYCYRIPSLAWKAERQRLERSGKMAAIKAHSSRRFSGLSENSDTVQMIPCGDQVYSTTKLFWRQNISADIRIWFSTTLDILTIQLYDETNRTELPLLHVCKSRCEDSIAAMQDTIGSSDGDNSNNDNDNVDERSSIDWDIIGKYLVSRLKLRNTAQCIAEDEVDRSTIDGIGHLTAAEAEAEAERAPVPEHIPFLCKLSGDSFNDSLVLPRPSNLSAPPLKLSEDNPISPHTFEKAVAGMKAANRRARASRQSAEKMEKLLTEALEEVWNER